jgi:transposase
MMPIPAGVRVWLATGHTDMRKGFDGLALMVQERLEMAWPINARSLRELRRSNQLVQQPRMILGTCGGAGKR